MPVTITNRAVTGTKICQWHIITVYIIDLKIFITVLTVVQDFNLRLSKFYQVTCNISRACYLLMFDNKQNC